jgi:valyl-tRNA synthetase
LIQDPDVLDTWFSSGLWPFSTLGWPQRTDDLKNFYPTSALVTGFDILFFWVARMIMMGLKFMDDVPFRDVYIHALVRDEFGQKMSKSKGNVIDPLDVMNEYGTDAFRFTLAAMAAMGRDIKLSPERIAGYQNFVNKLWNAARFVLLNAPRGAADFAGKPSALSVENLSFAERWVRSRLAAAIHEARGALEAYRFNDFANVLYQFTWHEFCDWYIEMSKPALNSAPGEDNARSRQLLVELLEQILLLLHPVMPFVTEEIWQALDGNGKTIMLQVYPRAAESWRDTAAEKDMEFLMGVIRAVRNLRTELNCPPGKEVKVIFHGLERELAMLKEHAAYLRLLARVGAAEYFAGGDRPKGAATAVVGATEIYLPLDDVLNLDEEHARLMKEAGKITAELARVQRKLGNGEFLSKAKHEIVQKERDKALQYEDKLRALNLSIARIGELKAGRD